MAAELCIPILAMAEIPMAGRVIGDPMDDLVAAKSTAAEILLALQVPIRHTPRGVLRAQIIGRNGRAF